MCLFLIFSAHDLIPKRAPPSVPLKIVNPPSSLKEKWTETLHKCGNKLLRNLTEFYLSQITSNEELAKEIITKASHIILPEFITNLPNIDDMIEEESQNLLYETSQSAKQPQRMKRKTESGMLQATAQPMLQHTLSGTNGFPNSSFKLSYILQSPP